MSKYIAQFEQHLMKEKNASQNTILSYIRDLNKFNEYVYSQGVKALSKCTPAHISGYIDYLKETGKSPSTITRATASLRAFFSYMQVQGAINLNPAKGIKSEKITKTLPRILTNKEVDLFLEQPKCDSLKGYRDKAMLELLYATGIRVSELISLNISDVNADIGFIRCGAGNSERVIPLYPAAISALADYLKHSRPLLLSNNAEKALFVNLNGGRMTRQGFWKIIKHYQETAKITTEITPHVLRHSFAAHLLENGADVTMIKEMMGHSDISSTLVYAQLIKNNLKSTYIKFHPRA